MTDVNLNAPNIGAIRKFVDSQTSRDQLKELALNAGASAERIMKIMISGNMGDPNYKSKATLMNVIFDTVYQDFDKPEADGIYLRMIDLLISPQGTMIPSEMIEELERGLAKSNLSIAQITGSITTVALLETATEQTRDSNMKEATELLIKGLLRLSTDKPGAITACTTACESVCRIALEQLRLPLPAHKQLPQYLNVLCAQTNIIALAQLGGEDTKKVFGALRGLAQNSYRAAHELGDRHAQGCSASETTSFAADIIITSCAALICVIAGAVGRNEIKSIN